jgi:glycosyltransferase involved in cell wall biosynthesis
VINHRRLLFIVNVDWFFVSHRLPIAIAAIKQGFEVHLACNVTDKKKLLESHGIIVHPLALSRSGIGILNELKTISQLFFIIREVKPNIIHSITIKPVLYGNLLARLLKVPVRVSSISGLGYVFIAQDLKTKILKFFVIQFYRFALFGSKAVIFQNHADINIFKTIKAVNEKQVVLIRGSGVDLTKYRVLPEPDNNPVVMFVARLLIDKGVNEFVQAAKLIRNIRPDIRMALVGDVDIENPKSIYPCQIRKWEQDDIVEYWGYSHNVAETISKANIIVLPSYREGLPKSLIEAAACGRAVITTDVPGCRDAIEVNKTGLLVPAKTVQPLVDAILKLVNDQKLRSEFAQKGRLFAEKVFDINDVVKKHLLIYQGE